MLEENDPDITSRPRLLGGFLRLEIGLGSLVNLLVIMTMIGSALISYETDRAQEQKTIALLEQRFVDFESSTQAQLAQIATQTSGYPNAVQEVSTVNHQLVTVSGQLSSLATRVGTLEQNQAVDASEINGLMRASRVVTSQSSRR